MGEIGMYQPFSRLFREFDRAPAAGFRVDVEEDGGQYRIRADLPGADKNDVNVNVENNVLSIGAALERGGENIVHNERAGGELKRAFRLPPQADAARIAASIQNGVLTVVVPKSKAAVGRKIEVR